jgi:hypothetical protein
MNTKSQAVSSTDIYIYIYIYIYVTKKNHFKEEQDSDRHGVFASTSFRVVG